MQPSDFITLNALITLSKNCCIPISVHRANNHVLGSFEFMVSTYRIDCSDINIWVNHENYLTQILAHIELEMNEPQELEENIWTFDC